LLARTFAPLALGCLAYAGISEFVAVMHGQSNADQAISDLLRPLPEKRLAPVAPRPLPPQLPLADFGTVKPSNEVRYLADWIATTRDAAGSFVVIDKKNARLYVFDADSRLQGSSPVLLGAALGDESAPGIGTRPLEKVLPGEKTTPAGRFVAERGHDARGEDVVWVDYDAGVSIHRVLTSNPKEHRLERLTTPTAADKRISFGCINVPVAFYEHYVRPTFAKYRSIVYVLPDIHSMDKVFGSYDVVAKLQSEPDAAVRLPVAAQAMR
jgi:hypothetical protein